MSFDKLLTELRQKAKAASRDGREAVVIELLVPYLRHVPDDGYAWYMLGDALRVVGRSCEAERALTRALEVAPASRRSYPISRLAKLYTDVGRYSDAERCFSELAADAEWNVLGWFWILRGANLAYLGDLPRAEECHRKATSLKDVDLDEAWLNLGLVLRAQGKYDEARNAVLKSLEFDPDSAAAEEALKSMDGVENAIAAAQGLPHRAKVRDKDAELSGPST